jgi:hypothetical protein
MFEQTSPQYKKEIKEKNYEWIKGWKEEPNNKWAKIRNQRKIQNYKERSRWEFWIPINRW